MVDRQGLANEDRCFDRVSAKQKVPPIFLSPIFLPIFRPMFSWIPAFAFGSALNAKLFNEREQ